MAVYSCHRLSLETNRKWTTIFELWMLWEMGLGSEQTQGKIAKVLKLHFLEYLKDQWAKC